MDLVSLYRVNSFGINLLLNKTVEKYKRNIYSSLNSSNMLPSVILGNLNNSLDRWNGGVLP